MKKYLFLMAAGAIALMACSSDDSNESKNNAPVPINLSSSLTMQNTRAVDDVKAQGTAIVKGETVYAWIDDRKTDNSALNQENYVTAWTLTADGTIGLTPAATKYYPTTGGNIDVYAIHGNFASAPTGNYPAVSATWTHTVLEDQATPTNLSTTATPEYVPANYAKSDLLYGSLQNETRKSASPYHAITFKHKLSKIEVYLKQDDNATVSNANLASAQVYIMNTLPDATFTFTAKEGALVQDGSESNDDFQIRYNAYGGSITAGGTAYANGIKMLQHTDATASGTAYPLFAEAIIVPQTIANTTDFLRIHLSDGGDLYAKLSATTTFVQGKKYTYTVTVGLTGITLTSSITDWGEGATDNLNANMTTN